MFSSIAGKENDEPTVGGYGVNPKLERTLPEHIQPCVRTQSTIFSRSTAIFMTLCLAQLPVKRIMNLRWGRVWGLTRNWNELFLDTSNPVPALKVQQFPP